MSTVKEESRFLLTISQGERLSDASENAVVRSVSEFRSLDAALRTRAADEEIILDDTLPPFPASVDEESLQVYMQTLLGMPKVVHSDALASFLTVVKDEQEDYPPDLEYVQYLLPGIQSRTFEPIPRFGSYQKAMDTILPGWWLVWYLALEGAESIVDFQVYTCGSEAGGAPQELVHQETCTSSSTNSGDQKKGYYFGSYRILSEPKLALLKVTGRSVLLTSGGRKVFVDCAAIPHDAFTAACTAAKDTNASAKRRRQAPMLSVILDYPNQVTVRVQKENSEEEDDKALSAETALNVVDVDQLTALKDQGVVLEQRASLLEAERDQVKAELTASSVSVKEMAEKLTMAESERRVWNMVRAELQSELSRLSHGLEQERSDKARVANELQEAQQELQEITGRLKLLELQSPVGVSSNGGETQIAELSSAMRKLKSDLKSKTRTNETLEGKIICSYCSNSHYTFALTFSFSINCKHRTGCKG
jgi:hypothetical protein